MNAYFKKISTALLGVVAITTVMTGTASATTAGGASVAASSSASKADAAKRAALQSSGLKAPQSLTNSGPSGARKAGSGRTIAATTSCRNAHIYEAAGGYRFQQYTYYCWYDNGANVYSVYKGQLSGWTNTLLAVALTSWRGTDSQDTQCYQGYGRSRGYCVQTSWGHFEQNTAVTQRFNIWTMVRVYYNGYAECANAHDSNWTKC